MAWPPASSRARQSSRPVVASNALKSLSVVAAMKTSPPAVTNLFLLAEAHERADLMRADLNRPGMVVAAVGPSTGSALRDQGVVPSVVADPPRLYPMLEAPASVAARETAMRRGSRMPAATSGSRGR